MGTIMIIKIKHRKVPWKSELTQNMLKVPESNHLFILPVLQKSEHNTKLLD